ncbi:hypothetical protein L2K20_29630 [Mycobacterium sp. MBM]|nr:hypothetical protein [Mycobacterium sp. MBM]
MTLLVDATAETARADGQAARDRRAESERRKARQATAARDRAIKQAEEARALQIRMAYSSAAGRAKKLAPVWLFLCFLVFVNNFFDNPVTGGGYVMTTLTFALIVGGCLAVELALGRGSGKWLVIGTTVGFAIHLVYMIFLDKVDLSLFWLTGVFGVEAYLLSAWRIRRNRQQP